MNQKHPVGLSVHWTVGGAAPVQAADAARYKDLLDKAIEIRNFEITQLQARNNFMLVAQAALVAAWVAVLKEGSPASVLLPLCGALLSIFQAQMAAGAKFWQARWELAAKQAEELYLQALGKNDEDKVHLFIEPKKAGNEEEKRLFQSIAASLKDSGKHRVGRLLDGFTNSMILQRFSVSRIPIYMSISFYVLWILLVAQSLHGMIRKFMLSF